MGQLDGRVAIVTGGAGSIGSASAAEFARQGAQVIVTDINDDEGESIVSSIRDEGGDAAYIHADVGETSQVDELVERAVAKYGRLDVLHTNTFWCKTEDVDKISDENWAKTLAITLDAVMKCSRASIKQMRKTGGGSIINTSSVNGSVISLANNAPYCAAKGAVTQLSRAIAKEYGRRGIRCNALCPGNVIRRKYAPENLDDDNIISWQTCLGRSAYSDEIAKVAAFLASDAASYITGATMMADCGWTSI
jgi:NAD(P)-dependent dehydrogenase (short-subunit alcohol dehydrogenase family)